MKPCQVIAELEELRAELDEMGVEGARLYLPVGHPPELIMPWPWGRQVSVTWEEGLWCVTVAQQHPSGVLARVDDYLCDTLAECMAWLAREGE